MDIIQWIGVGAVAIVGFLILLDSFFTVDQQMEGVVQRFGKFVRFAKPGFHFKIPMFESVGEVNLRVQQLDVEVETKTQDNVFVKVVVSVQYYVDPEKVYEAFYKLNDRKKQITSYVFDVVRARVPKMDLDDVFDKKDEIADAVKSELSETMRDFGYGITKALITDIDPDAKVKESMNEINAAKRLREAAEEKGEAQRILTVKAAEADAESKKLSGQGIADQRKAIVDGLRNSVAEFKDQVDGVTSEDVLSLVLMTQYFDTMKEIGASSRTNTLFIPSSPGAVKSLGEEIRDGMLVAGRAGPDGDGGDDDGGGVASKTGLDSDNHEENDADSEDD